MIVEDGTGKADSNSYVSVDFSDLYAGSIGMESWIDADNEEKEQALVRATAYIERKYQFTFIGSIKSDDQALSWPRSNADGPIRSYDDNVVPEPVKKAVAEAAFVSLNAELEPELARGGRILSESVGPISVTYADDAKNETEYPKIKREILPVLQKVSNRIYRQ